MPLPATAKKKRETETKQNSMSISHDYGADSPSNEGIFRRGRPNFVHNDETIQQSENLRNILEEAKKARRADIEAQAKGKPVLMKTDKKLSHVKQSHKQSPHSGMTKRQAVAHNTPPNIESKRISSRGNEIDRIVDNKQ